MRRGLAAFLALALLLCMAPVAAYAAENNETFSSEGKAAAVQPQTDEATITQGPAAVEDVAEISAAPAAAPTIEQIAPVEAERILPAAALQSSATFDNDIDAIQFGMIVRADAPDGTVHYYDNLGEAAADAAAWNESGGRLFLLRDYTVADDGTVDSHIGLMNYSSNNHNGYETTEDGLTFRGFWFDLGGHTLTAKLGRPLIYRGGVAHVNVKNGRIIYQNNGRQGVVLGAITTGLTVTPPYSDGILQSVFNFKNASVLSLTEQQGFTAAAVCSSLWTNEVNLYDSALIAQNASGVRIVKSKAEISGAALEAYTAAGAVSAVHLHGASAVGSTGSYGAIQYTKTGNGTVEGIAHSIAATADSADARFLGTTVIRRESGSSFVTVVAPEGEIVPVTYSLALPDAATITQTALDAVPAYLAEAEYPAFRVHVHEAVFCAETPATYHSPGCAQHWECACGKLFTDASCGQETTPEALALPSPAFPIEGAQYSDPVAPTYAAAGSIGYWYTGDGTRYSDTVAAEPIVLTEAETAVPRLSDAAGLSDEELIALDAVVKVEGSDGTATAYDSIPAAYANAKSRTGGATVRLLRDFLWEDPATGNADGQIKADKLPNAASYQNDEIPEMPVHGFWFDLGGHTLTARLGKSIYYSGESCWVNIRNGRVIYQNTGRGSALIFGAITFGWTQAEPAVQGVVRHPVVNLYGVEIFSLDALNDKQNPAVISSSVWNTTINVRDCTLIADTSEPAIEYYKSGRTIDGSNLTALQNVGANFTVNVQGASTVGSLNADRAAIVVDVMSGGTATGIPHRATVNAADGVTFLGKKLASVTTAAAALYEHTPPAFTQTQLTLAFPGIEEEAAYTAWQHVHEPQYVPEQPAGVGQAGCAGYWYCPGCGRYWKADGVTATTPAELTLAPIPLIEVVSAESQTGAETRDVPVELRLTDNPGIAGGTTVLRYDPRLTLKSIEQGPALASLNYTIPGGMAESVDENGKTVRLSWDGLEADHANGVLLTLTFTVPTAEEGSFAIGLETETGDFYDGDLNDVAVATADGGITVTCEHVWGLEQTLTAATCVTPGEGLFRCAVCGKQEEQTIAALGHELTHHEAQAATCTEIGWNAYDTCSRCGYTTYTELAALGHTERAVVTPATCVRGGYTTYTCTRCRNVRVADETAPLGHNPVHHEAQAATHTQIGWEAYDTCTRCSYTTYVEIPKIPYEPGDLNRDDRVDSRDVTLLRRYLAGGYGVTFSVYEADFNMDWVVNGKDVTLLRKSIVGGYGVVLRLNDADALRPNETPRIVLD